MRKEKYIVYSLVVIFILFICYYFLAFLSFRFLTTSDIRGNLDCADNLRKIYIALGQYNEQYGTSPASLAELVKCNLLTHKTLKCPLFNRFKVVGLNVSYNKPRDCDYSYNRANAKFPDSAFDLENDKIVCQDNDGNHRNTRFDHINTLFQNGNIKNIIARMEKISNSK